MEEEGSAMNVRLQAAAAAAAFALLWPRPAAAQPVTPRIAVTDTYHGVKVVDDYRWLENGANPKVRAWSDAQNARARAFLDALPGRRALAAEIERLVTSRAASISGPVVRREDVRCFDPARKQQPWIVQLASLATTRGHARGRRPERARPGRTHRVRLVRAVPRRGGSLSRSRRAAARRARCTSSTSRRAAREET